MTLSSLFHHFENIEDFCVHGLFFFGILIHFFRSILVSMRIFIYDTFHLSGNFVGPEKGVLGLHL